MTLSWFRLGAQSTESIVDVLRAASPSGSTSAGPAHTLREGKRFAPAAVCELWSPHPSTVFPPIPCPRPFYLPSFCHPLPCPQPAICPSYAPANLPLFSGLRARHGSARDMGGGGGLRGGRHHHPAARGHSTGSAAGTGCARCRGGGIPHDPPTALQAHFLGGAGGRAECGIIITPRKAPKHPESQNLAPLGGDAEHAVELEQPVAAAVSQEPSRAAAEGCAAGQAGGFVSPRASPGTGTTCREYEMVGAHGSIAISGECWRCWGSWKVSALCVLCVSPCGPACPPIHADPVLTVLTAIHRQRPSTRPPSPGSGTRQTCPAQIVLVGWAAAPLQGCTISQRHRPRSPRAIPTARICWTSRRSRAITTSRPRIQDSTPSRRVGKNPQPPGRAVVPVTRFRDRHRVGKTPRPRPPLI